MLSPVIGIYREVYGFPKEDTARFDREHFLKIQRRNDICLEF